MAYDLLKELIEHVQLLEEPTRFRCSKNFIVLVFYDMVLYCQCCIIFHDSKLISFPNFVLLH